MIITLLTDFGTADHFVGVMKGAILSVNLDAKIVDITHEIPSHDIDVGAFTLYAAHQTFPAGTVHIGVVDPGVGSARRPIVVAGGEHFFVGPDNGLFTYIYDYAPGARVFHLTNNAYFRPSVSATFHGRDVFAPVAAALASGVALEALGEEIDDYVRLKRVKPKRVEDGTLEASIIHIDRFGNCITDITRNDLSDDMIAYGARVVIDGHEIRSFRRFFAENGNKRGELFAMWGSAGFLEIAMFCDSAAQCLGARRGGLVELQSLKPKVQTHEAVQSVMSKMQIS